MNTVPFIASKKTEIIKSDKRDAVISIIYFTANGRYYLLIDDVVFGFTSIDISEQDAHYLAAKSHITITHR